MRNKETSQRSAAAFVGKNPIHRRWRRQRQNRRWKCGEWEGPAERQHSADQMETEVSSAGTLCNCLPSSPWNEPNDQTKSTSTRVRFSETPFPRGLCVFALPYFFLCDMWWSTSQAKWKREMRPCNNPPSNSFHLSTNLRNHTHTKAQISLGGATPHATNPQPRLHTGRPCAATEEKRSSGYNVMSIGGLRGVCRARGERTAAAGSRLDCDPSDTPWLRTFFPTFSNSLFPRSTRKTHSFLQFSRPRYFCVLAKLVDGRRRIRELFCDSAGSAQNLVFNRCRHRWPLFTSALSFPGCASSYEKSVRYSNRETGIHKC